jgi:hypothetical protein
VPTKVKYIARAKAHIRYRQLKPPKKIVPGITTITGKMVDANILARWANGLGLQGYDSSKYVDELATVGTLEHHLVECDLQNLSPALDDYTKNQIDQAEKIFENKFLKWKAEHNIVLVAMERPLVSELYPFGGTGDIYCFLDGKFTYIDVKTSKGCYENHKVQSVACAKLWEEKIGDTVEDIRILRLGRNAEEGFEEIHIGQWDARWELFLKYLDAYHLEKKIGKGGG